jgi:hypothetical protein
VALSDILLLGQPASGAQPSRAGNVRLDARQFADDGGIWPPLGDTLFTIVWMAGHDVDMLDRELSLTQGEFVRALGEVGGTSWEDRTIDPRDADYSANLALALEAAWAHGKRVFLTIFGGGVLAANELDAAVDRILAVCVPRQRMLQAVEIANEDNFVGTPDDLRRLARKISAALPGVPLMPHSGDVNSENLADIAVYLDVCNALNAHLDRTPGDKDWRQVRQTWGINNPCAHTQGEPSGIHLHQNQDIKDPVRMAFMWLVGCLNAFTGFVIHSGAGVRSGGSYDRGMGRPASFADPEMADYPAYVAKCRELVALLPAGVCNWQKTSQRGTSPWADNFLWSDAIWSDGADHGVSRNYVAYSGDKFVALTFGVLNVAQMLNTRHLVADIHDAYSGAVTPLDVAAGVGFKLAGNAETDAAYVIVGTFS